MKPNATVARVRGGTLAVGGPLWCFRQHRIEHDGKAAHRQREDQAYTNSMGERGGIDGREFDRCQDEKRSGNTARSEPEVHRSAIRRPPPRQDVGDRDQPVPPGPGQPARDVDEPGQVGQGADDPGGAGTGRRRGRRARRSRAWSGASSRVRSPVAAEDQPHRLGAGGRVAQLAADGRGDGPRAGLADAAHRHAQVLALDDDDDPARLEVLDRARRRSGW